LIRLLDLFSVFEPRKLNLTFKHTLIIISPLFIIYLAALTVVFNFGDLIVSKVSHNIPPGTFLIGKLLALHCLTLCL